MESIKKFTGICSSKGIVQPLFDAENLKVKQLLTSAESRNVSMILILFLTLFQKMWLLLSECDYLLKVHKCRFKNISICSNSYKNNTLKSFHS